MKTTQQNENVKITFTMIDDNLLSTPVSRITAQQKLFISWILRFQKNDLECFATNKTIGETLGMSKDGVKSLIKSCSHSFTFFTCTPDTRDNGVPFHTLSINLEELFKFIANDKPVAKIKRRNKPSTENKAPETTISTQPIPEVQVKEKVSEIDYNDLEIDVMSLFGDATRINDKIDDILFDELLTFIEILKNKVIDFNSVTLKYSVIKKLKNLIDNSNISDELKNNLNNCIDNFDPSTYEKSKIQLLMKN